MRITSGRIRAAQILPQFRRQPRELLGGHAVRRGRIVGPAAPATRSAAWALSAKVRWDFQSCQGLGYEPTLTALTMLLLRHIIFFCDT
jgi:hypothetical protein